MRADGVGPRLVLLLLVRLCVSSAARGPGPERAQAQPGIFLACECRLGVLPQLLGVGQVADAGVELAQELLRLGVDLLALPVGEVFGLWCLGLCSGIASPGRWCGGEVGLSNVLEVGVE